jgi:hypothetical protein
MHGMEAPRKPRGVSQVRVSVQKTYSCGMNTLTSAEVAEQVPINTNISLKRGLFIRQNRPINIVAQSVVAVEKTHHEAN